MRLVLLLLVVGGCDDSPVSGCDGDCVSVEPDLTVTVCGPSSCSAGCCGTSTTGALVCLAGSDDTNCGSGGNDCLPCGVGTHCDTGTCVSDSTDFGPGSSDLACMRSSSPAILGTCSGGGSCTGGYVCVLGACHKRCLNDCDCPAATLCVAGSGGNACQ